MRFILSFIFILFFLIACTSQTRLRSNASKISKEDKPSLYSHKIKIPTFSAFFSNYSNGYTYDFVGEKEEIVFLPKYLPSIEYNIEYKRIIVGVGYMNFQVLEPYYLEMDYYFLKIGLERNIGKFVLNGSYVFTQTSNSFIYFERAGFFDFRQYNYGIEASIAYPIYKNLHIEIANIYMEPLALYYDGQINNSLDRLRYFQSLGKIFYKF